MDHDVKEWKTVSVRKSAVGLSAIFLLSLIFLLASSALTGTSSRGLVIQLIIAVVLAAVFLAAAISRLRRFSEALTAQGDWPCYP